MSHSTLLGRPGEDPPWKACWKRGFSGGSDQSQSGGVTICRTWSCNLPRPAAFRRHRVRQSASPAGDDRGYRFPELMGPARRRGSSRRGSPGRPKRGSPRAIGRRSRNANWKRPPWPAVARELTGFVWAIHRALDGAETRSTCVLTKDIRASCSLRDGRA